MNTSDIISFVTFVVAIRISECSITSAAAPINAGLNLKAGAALIGF